MKILYTSDLHGRRKAYENVLERAVSQNVNAIVNGGDLYPLGANLFAVQKEFLQNFFPEYLYRLEEKRIIYLATLGNMDLRGLDETFRLVMEQTKNAFSLLENRVLLNGYCFIGSAMTVDGPFALKDRCLRDITGSPAPVYRGQGLVSDNNGIQQTKDWTVLVKNLPSLEQHLQTLPVPDNPEKTVYVLHQPPHGTGLGIISSGADVGSRAVARFLDNSGALLSLHGHIHESPFSGGTWRARIGRTTCIQPGQLPGDKTVSVMINLETMEMERTL